MPRNPYRRPVEEGVVRDLKHNGYEILSRGHPFCLARKDKHPVVVIYIRRKMKYGWKKINDGLTKAHQKQIAAFEQGAKEGFKIVRIG